VVWTIGLLGLVLGIVLVLIAVIVWAVRRPGLSHIDRWPQSRDHGGS
jgi:hypothetical protein